MSSLRNRRIVTVRSAGFCEGFTGFDAAAPGAGASRATVGLVRAFFAGTAAGGISAAGGSTTATAGPEARGASFLLASTRERQRAEHDGGGGEKAACQDEGRHPLLLRGMRRSRGGLRHHLAHAAAGGDRGRLGVRDG